MLSFLHQLAATDVTHRHEVDTSTSGESAFVYTGGHHTQIPTDTTRIRVDQKAKHLDGRVNYRHIFSLELPGSILKMDANLTQGTSCLAPSKIVQAMQNKIASYKPLDVFKSDGMRSLRNVAFPPDLSDRDLPTFGTNTDLGKVLPAKRNSEYLYRMLCNGYALRNRFDGLPVHKICYYHSHDTAEVAIRNLRSELSTQSCFISRASRGNTDCLGMTPLHILACSTKHHPALYQMIISKYPGHLIAQDIWGDIPLLYALWGRAPRDIVDLLATSLKQYHESYNIDWEKMIETLCTGLAPIASVDYLVETNRRHFPHQQLQDIDWNSMVKVLCTKAKASEEQIGQFVKHYRDLLSDLEQVPLQLAKEEKFGFKPFWLRVGISDRIMLLNKENTAWRQDIESLIKDCPTGASDRSVKKRSELMKLILRKLAFYEVVAQMWVLDLVLWKAKLEESKSSQERQRKSYRSHCRFISGASVIIPNVMEYLLDSGPNRKP
eukprot:CCRYP_004902-RA/>CCRYP_004902-RA protein AED:0.03 eAED:0.03 QI:276/1/1/1/1/1/3/468/492